MHCFFHCRGKRQARVFILIFSLALTGLNFGALGQQSGLLPEKPKSEVSSVDERSLDVFATKVAPSALSYRRAIEKMVINSETKGGVRVIPSVVPEIGIKIETTCAPGLQVSPMLVDGLLSFLRSRGYAAGDVFLAGQSRRNLRMGGFLAPSAAGFYRGHRLYSSDDKGFFDDRWFHDSPMPPTTHDRARFFLRFADRQRRNEEERKSYLPARLFLGDTHWINLAVAMDNLNLGIAAAAANMSLGAIDNYRRFLEKPTLAPAAAAEILAIPEIWEKRLFSIVDLSEFQFAGGGRFDAEFIGRDPKLLFGENPFAVDFFALRRLAEARVRGGFSPRKPKEVLLFRYARELGLGDVGKSRYFEIP